MIKYKCKNCENNEFISQLNVYDIFESKENKIILIDSVRTEDERQLFCRKCFTKLEFDENDVKV